MLFTYLRITDYSFASLCIMYVWLNLLRRVLCLKWLHALMFPLLNTASRPLSTCFRSNCFDFDFPCIRFCFPDRALPFPYPFPNKNMKMKVVRVFSRSFPTAFIPSYHIVWVIELAGALNIYGFYFFARMNNRLTQLKFSAEVKVLVSNSTYHYQLSYSHHCI